MLELIILLDASQDVAVPWVVPIDNEPLVNDCTRKTKGGLSTTSSPFVTRLVYETTDNVFWVPVNGDIEVNVGIVLEIGDMEVNIGGAILDVFATPE